MNKKQLAFLILIHFMTDAYTSFSASLMPLISTKLDLTFTLVGTLTSVTAFASLLQPAYGMISDRIQYRLFTFIGPIFCAIFLSSIGLAPSFWILSLFMLLGYLGNAAFHPQTAALAGMVSGSRKGLGISVWIFGGSLGLSFGPLFIVWVVQTFGLERSYLAAIPGLLAAAVLFRYLPFNESKTIGHPLASVRSPLLPSSKRLYPIFILYLFVVIRTLVRMALLTFLPLLLTAKGISLAMAGMTISLFALFAAIGGIVGGVVYDKTRSKSLLIISIILAIPLLFMFFKAPWPAALIFLVFGAMTLEASNSVVVVMAQEIIPENASTTSSLVMGFGWGTAGLIMALVGNLGDRLGLEATLILQVFLLVIALGCALALPGFRKSEKAITAG